MGFRSLNHPHKGWLWSDDELRCIEAKIAEVIAAEREACAVLCETTTVPIDIVTWTGTRKGLTTAVAQGLAARIRSRNNL